MIDPKQFGAVPFALPEKLAYVRDIENVHGPLLVEFRGESGEPYLYYWCDRDRDEGIDRWLVLRTIPAQIVRYLTGLAVLRELVEHAAGKTCYIVDYDRTNATRGVWYIATAHLPPKYLPTPQSRRTASAVLEGDLQEIFFSGELGTDKVVEYRRKYKQATTISALYGRNSSSESVAITHNLKNCGYAYWSLYQDLGRSVPPHQRAVDRGLAYMSPGFMRFGVDPDVADSIREAVRAFQRNRTPLLGNLAALRRWANAEIARLDQRRGRRARASQSETISETQARALFRDICRAFQLDPVRLLSTSKAGFPTAAKALLSYSNRIAFLADKDTTQDAVMVGLTVDREPLPDDDDVSAEIDDGDDTD